MRVIAISGSRTITDQKFIGDCIRVWMAKHLDDGDTVKLLIGDAQGVDWNAYCFANKNSLQCALYCADPRRHELFSKRLYEKEVYLPASWEVDGRRAGPLRNECMIAGADDLITIWDGRSPGTYGAMRIAERLGVPVYPFQPPQATIPGCTV
jgi:hypothetical protein